MDLCYAISPQLAIHKLQGNGFMLCHFPIDNESLTISTYLASEVFTCYREMLMLFGDEVWTGKIPHSSLKAHPNSHARHKFFPTHGLAVVVKKDSTTRGFATRGGIFFHHAC